MFCISAPAFAWWSVSKLFELFLLRRQVDSARFDIYSLFRPLGLKGQGVCALGLYGASHRPCTLNHLEPQTPIRSTMFNPNRGLSHYGR